MSGSADCHGISVMADAYLRPGRVEVGCFGDDGRLVIAGTFVDTFRADAGLRDGTAGAAAALRTVLTTPFRPSAMLRNASSALLHLVTGRPSLGSSLNPAARVDFQSQGRTTAATTFMVPRARRFIARRYSMFQQ